MKVKIMLMIFLLVFSGAGIAMAHSGMAMPGQNGPSGNTMPGMKMVGGIMQINETPPNMKILGTFGAINLAFIAVGNWKKRFKRKEGSNVSSKS